MSKIFKVGDKVRCKYPDDMVYENKIINLYNFSGVIIKKSMTVYTVKFGNIEKNLNYRWLESVIITMPEYMHD